MGFSFLGSVTDIMLSQGPLSYWLNGTQTYGLPYDIQQHEKHVCIGIQKKYPCTEFSASDIQMTHVLEG